jgi:excisionase family DNA binding protein
MMQQQGGLAAPAVGSAGVVPPAGVAGPGASAGGAAPEILTPADVARVLGVSEADVIATLDAGELKGKKIGSAYRVTRAALDEFLKH